MSIVTILSTCASKGYWEEDAWKQARPVVTQSFGGLYLPSAQPARMYPPESDTSSEVVSIILIATW